MGEHTKTMAAVRRASKEFKNVASQCSEFVKVEFEGDNALAWNCTMAGPPGTPYEGADFALKVEFPADYPFKPPSVTFSNAASVYHPNVNEDGLICLELLKTKYSSACSLPQVLNAIHTLLEVPSTDAPLRPDVGNQYENDRDAFNAAAREAAAKA